MGIRFQKSIKIMKGVKLNISKSGVSVTVGKKGASVNLGGKGTYLNLGLPGTGLSYRQKITGNIGSLIKKKLGGAKDQEGQEVIEEYAAEHEAYCNTHKYTDNVMTLSKLSASLDDGLINGDKKAVEEKIGEFNGALELPYEIGVNYSLDGNKLYADLDLPEIEDLQEDYPSLKADGTVSVKKKSKATLKEEYAQVVVSIGIFLAANYFNISPAIKTIVLSAFTQKKNKAGEEVDTYIYSVQFLRGAFEKIDLSKIDDVHHFITQFDCRMNMSESFTFKAISPFEMPESDDLGDIFTKGNALVEEAIKNLEAMGFDAKELAKVKEKLEGLDLASAKEYMKEAMKLLSE